MTFGVLALAAAHQRGERTVGSTVEEVLAACAAHADPAVWISRVDDRALRARAAQLDAGPRDLPLLGVPFAVKDNLDVAGMPTTAACPGVASIAEHSAFVVQRLLDAGAVLVGKTNMDQFATGLVGTRSPHGAPRSVVDPERVSGGSSSGSGVAVAAGLVAFALGTDTAGSGRVPAAFNGILGLKPTLGRLSTSGLLPACRSLDCASVFARDAADAAAVLAVVDGFDAADPFARRAPATSPGAPDGAVLGVPRAEDLEALEDGAVRDAWRATVARAALAADEVVEVDVAPFLQAARLLYEGPWLAERYAAFGAWLEDPDVACDPTVEAIVLGGRDLRASDLFRAQERLAALRRATEPVWSRVSALVLPTAPCHPTFDEVAADPVGVNARLGTYTNFVNLLDLAAVAVPGAARVDGLPFGATLVGPAWSDERLLGLAGRLERAGTETLDVAVVGAHLHGMARNGELLDAGAQLVGAVRTAPAYRLFDLADGTGRPGLVRDEAAGAAIEAEVWRLPSAAVGSFLAGVRAPLAIGTLELEDGRAVHGFLCEAHAVADAVDVTASGGWRHHVAALA
ncbi:allophanate hydrolase [Conexibacter sp. SYSU D00693]|uniref:allophanate hydrolase n=1 Tax=Conexibacter sp. SYSU D00693 TaxID=2812560 RepID=UPI00196B02D2|nr:allophanate hydrolase [Conexibacter sp. SYSU D00693]